MTLRTFFSSLLTEENRIDKSKKADVSVFRFKFKKDLIICD